MSAEHQIPLPETLAAEMRKCAIVTRFSDQTTTYRCDHHGIPWPTPNTLPCPGAVAAVQEYDALVRGDERDRHRLWIYDEVRAERERAHQKHGSKSIEGLPMLDLRRLAVLVEEVGEVAREFNDARDGQPDLSRLRAEMIQVAAVATAWADVLTVEPKTDPEGWFIDSDGQRWGHCNACGEERAPEDECCDDGEIVP